MEERESKYNGHIKVSRSLGLGTYIQAEGLTQSGGIVGTIWKPVVKKIKKFGLEINSVLILGLGGGTVAKYLKLYFPNVQITGIDIDSMMVELGKKYLGLDQIPITVKIGDAFDYVKNSKKKYDLIIIDLYNGDKFPEKFENEKFINSVKEMIFETGMVVFNRLYYGDKRPEAVKFGRQLEKKFDEVTWIYPEANLMLLCGCFEQ